jgi:chromosome segregation ATPase
MGFREAFARGRQEGIARRPPTAPSGSWPDQEPPAQAEDDVSQARIAELEAECAKKNQALGELAAFVEQLQARIADLVGKLRDLGKDYDQKVLALNELIPFADKLKAGNVALEAECKELQDDCAKKKAALDAVTPVVAQLQARIAELEEAPDDGDVFADVLRLPAISTKSVRVPAVRNLLADRFHPEKHPKAEGDGLLALNEATLKINAAYDAIKRRRRPLGE